jgi:hypothetical protein
MSQDQQNNTFQPGPIVLFGSGETSPGGRKIYEYIFRSLHLSPKVALLETPAGFELNSDQVIERVGEFLKNRLQNYDPQIEIVPARKRGTYYSPDNPRILSPLLNADLIFMGPGSPTYAVRQLRNSMTWQMLIAHHCLGGAIALASAATVAFGSYTLPVYEIYKVGEDLHWKDGLDFFGLYGLPLVFVPHWNNNDGGDKLDTSHCFMGKARFTPLLEMLPANIIVIGVDELTALIIEPASGECRVIGKGGVILLRTGKAITPATDASHMDAVVQNHADNIHRFQEGDSFLLSEIGPFHPINPEAVLPPDIWLQAQKAKQKQKEADLDTNDLPSEDIIKLVNEREMARSRKDWETADNLREDIARLGWEVVDTLDGPQLNRSDN